MTSPQRDTVDVRVGLETFRLEPLCIKALRVATDAMVDIGRAALALGDPDLDEIEIGRRNLALANTTADAMFAILAAELRFGQGRNDVTADSLAGLIRGMEEQERFAQDMDALLTLSGLKPKTTEGAGAGAAGETIAPGPAAAPTASPDSRASAPTSKPRSTTSSRRSSGKRAKAGAT